ncbi:MAG: (Fe-S)-binding protein [Thermodesulfovibrionales bacterium]|nr:(Fe-S)-binding protein [Thermodesulfovibrionales bacterium]
MKFLTQAKDSNLKNLRNYSNCVRCGKCKAHCPTYLENPSESMSSRGRIAIINKFNGGQLQFSNKLYESLYSCILCGSCSKACPMRIEITESIYEIRKKLKEHKKNIFLDNFLKFVFKSHHQTFLTLKVLKLIADIPKINALYPFKYLNRYGVIKVNNALRGKNFVYKTIDSKARIAMFTGCLVNCLFTSYGKNLINLLNTMGYDVILPAAEVCCGAPLLEAGLEGDAMKLAEMNLHAFKNLNVQYTICLCPTCIHFIKNIYSKYLGQSIENAIDISTFLILKKEEFKQLLIKGLEGKKFKEKIVYHDPCHLKNSLSIYNEPRKVLNYMGFNILEPSESGCCGFGGSFGLNFEKLSESILNRRLSAYKDADMVVTACPGCVLQLNTGGRSLKISHIIDLLGKLNSN